MEPSGCPCPFSYDQVYLGPQMARGASISLKHRTGTDPEAWAVRFYRCGRSWPHDRHGAVHQSLTGQDRPLRTSACALGWWEAPGQGLPDAGEKHLGCQRTVSPHGSEGAKEGPFPMREDAAAPGGAHPTLCSLAPALTALA